MGIYAPDGSMNSSIKDFNTSFKDGFDTYTPGVNWTQVIDPTSNDIVRLDGNAAGASYIVISKDPLVANTSTTLTSTVQASFPIELDVGIHMSQRTWGQDVSIEMVSPDTTPAYVDVAISSIQQTTTTLTVNTVTNHNLSVGNSISIYGVNDSRFNYPAVVVASTPSPTQFTVTAGPNGNLPSVTAGPFSTGFVTSRPRMGHASSGASMILESSTATNASFYVRADAGDSLASGVMAGNQSSAISTTASIQAVNSAYNFAFQPTTQYSLSMLPDKIQWTDAAVDAITQENNRSSRSQVIPSQYKKYNLRFRCSNNQGLSVPVAKIVSMTKTASTTATVTTDVPHGLTTSDLVVIYGSSDQVNFANALTATAVASVVDSTHFTIVFGASATATAYGGTVARVNGGNLPSALGYNAVVANSATLATAADGTQALTLTGNTNWAGLLIGDYVNVHGLKSVPATGADLGCDGAWQVRNVSTTTLELGPIGNTVPPANFGATACGGTVIKRTDLRISYVRITDFLRARVELLPRPVGDIGSSIPVVVQNSQVAGTALMGDVNFSGRATTGGFTAVRVVSAATTNGTNSKATAGRVYFGIAVNTSAAAKYVKFYNKATAPTVGTDTPVLTLQIPANSSISLSDAVGIYGLFCSAGIGFGITGAAADNDTTAVAAGDVILQFSYV